MNSSHWIPQVQNLLDKRLLVLGYYASDYPGDFRALNSLSQHAGLIDAYADFAFLLHSDGTFTGQIDEQALAEAPIKGIAPLILFHNFTGGFFDPEPLRAVLSSTLSQRRCIENMLATLPTGAAGVHVDFEGVEGAYRIAYVTFLESLAAVLHQRGLLLTIAVPTKRSEWEAPGYDFSGIGRICDLVTIMTYDEHYSGGSPGPIASLPWMTQALDYAIQFIPRHKILLGIPVYGYDWSARGTTMVPMRDIKDLIIKTGARPLWSDPAVEPYFYYWQGRERHTVWYENEISIKVRLGFIKSYRLRGIAIWRLGYETNKFWQVIESKFGR